FHRRKEDVAPVEPTVIVVMAVLREIGVDHDEPRSAVTEGVITAIGGDAGIGDLLEDLALGQIVHVVVAEDVERRPAEALKLAFDRDEMGKSPVFRLSRGHVLVVTQMGGKVDALSPQTIDRLAHLAERFAIKAGALRIGVRVMRVSDETETEAGTRRGRS